MDGGCVEVKEINKRKSCNYRVKMNRLEQC